MWTNRGTENYMHNHSTLCCSLWREASSRWRSPNLATWRLQPHPPNLVAGAHWPKVCSRLHPYRNPCAVDKEWSAVYGCNHPLTVLATSVIVVRSCDRIVFLGSWFSWILCWDCWICVTLGLMRTFCIQNILNYIPIMICMHSFAFSLNHMETNASRRERGRTYNNK